MQHLTPKARGGYNGAILNSKSTSDHDTIGFFLDVIILKILRRKSSCCTIGGEIFIAFYPTTLVSFSLILIYLTGVTLNYYYFVIPTKEKG